MHPRRGKIEPARLAGWKAEQARLGAAMIEAPLPPLRLVAGADCALLDGDILAAAVLWDVATQAVVAQVTARLTLDVPYIPGYLGFREAPAVRAALAQLPKFDAVMCDGAGFAHPRRCGLAVQVGVTLDVPCIGVAKSRLLGRHETVANTPGAYVPLMDADACIGAVLRTRVNVRPLYVSVGHRCDLAGACAAVMGCRTRYRLPEPTRLADAAVAAFKRSQL